MDSIQLAVPEEIALEGLDGITLDGNFFRIFSFQFHVCYDLLLFSTAIWFRLSERLKIPLPINEHLRNDIWRLIQSCSCFEYFEIAKDRETPKRMDRKEYYFNTEIPDDDMMNHLKSTYYIYTYHPVDDSNIRGSCEEFKTRKKIPDAVIKGMCLTEVTEK